MKKVISCRAVLIKDNKILLIQHKHDEKEFWVLPGGRIDKEETIIECIEREMKEETNLDIKAGKIVAVGELFKDDEHRIDFFIRAEMQDPNQIPMLGIDPEEEKRENPTLKDLKFFPVEELDRINLLPPEIVQIVKENKAFAYLGRYQH